MYKIFLSEQNTLIQMLNCRQLYDLTMVNEYLIEVLL